MSTLFAIIVAAGKGERLGSKTPKQFLPLGNTTILDKSYDAIASLVSPENIYVVLPEGYDYTGKITQTVTGGKTRQESVYKGLHALKGAKDKDIVLIHDAARPFTDYKDIQALIQTIKDDADAASLAAPVTDSLRKAEGNVIDRDGLYALQTPQGFRFKTIMDAHEAHHKDGNFTDDTSIVAANGAQIVLVPSSTSNFKITTTQDYKMAQALSSPAAYRIGQGFDVHAFDEETSAKHITLCGINIPHDRKLKGHSDADVGLHAITDALLGAIGAGDIGEHFPPSDDTFKNMDSAIFLEKAVTLVQKKNGIISNIDVTLICEAPKISAYKKAMQERIAKICHLNNDQVNVKATTTEKLGFTGRKEGIAAQASVLIGLMP